VKAEHSGLSVKPCCSLLTPPLLLLLKDGCVVFLSCRDHVVHDPGELMRSSGHRFWEAQPAVNVTSPPVLLLESRDCRPPAPVPKPPKLIEVPQTKEADAPSKPELPTLFVFANGERLEARRYMLTTDCLHVAVGRQERIISIGRLDLDATIAANRERGIELQIPTDSNHIFLGF
jgi:hypothetical protein